MRKASPHLIPPSSMQKVEEEAGARRGLHREEEIGMAIGVEGRETMYFAR